MFLLHPQNFLGLFLGGCAFFVLLALMLYPLPGVRRAVLGFKFGNAQIWRTWHLYLGAAYFVLMLLHSGFRWPNDWLTGMLFYASAAMTLTGSAWLVLQIYLPRLNAKLKLAERPLFERMPAYHAHLRTCGEELAADAHTHLEIFFREKWLPLMADLKFSWAYLFTEPIDLLAHDFFAVQSLLTEEEKNISKKLRDLYVEKSNLEAAYSLQLVLKRFHLVHGPLAFVVMALALVHAISVLVF